MRRVAFASTGRVPRLLLQVPHRPSADLAGMKLLLLVDKI